MIKKYYFFLLLFFSLSSLLYGEDVKFVINAPAATVKGAQIQVRYILQGGEGSSVDIPDEVKGFDVLYGPSVSQVYSSSNINGKVTSESNITYTWILMANEEGTFTLPAATVKVNGRNYKSNTATIKVLPQDKNAQPQQPGRQPETTVTTSVGANVSSDDVFIRPIFSKTKVNEQEAVVVTYRLYSVLGIRQFGQVKFPEFEGFMTEEFNLAMNQQIGLEHFKGRNYNTVDIKKSLLFPQRSGKITIPAGTVEALLVVPTGERIRTFFGTQELTSDVKKVLQIAPVTVDVAPLPLNNKPSNFSGGVGTFTFKPSITSQKVKANDAVTIKLDISGTGNMKLIRNPEVKLPKDFEVYDPKVTNNFNTTERGLSGTKSIEYLFIPRYPGKFTIPAIEFSYFDTQTKSYKTLSSPAYDLEVEKDPNASNNTSATSYATQQEVKAAQDIRYLKTGDIKYINPFDFLFGSTIYFLWYIIPIVIFVLALILYRKQIKANANVAMQRTKKANKVALKRLKTANKYLQAHDKDNFYDEVLRALWGYLSDKLTLPLSVLNRENIESELRQYGVSDELINRFISILDTCEFARYAPSDSDDAMDVLYNETVDAIGKMENTIKIK